MEPTSRSNVGNSTGGQNIPPNNATPQQSAQPANQPGYDPIFSPTGRAGVQSAPTTPTIVSGTSAPLNTPPSMPPNTPPAPTIASSPTTPPPTPNHTASTATGDIILQPGAQQPNNKSKLPLIIGLSIAIIAIIAGLIILIANPFGGGKTASTATTTSFNKFMNYLYDGSDATGYNEDAYADTATYKFEEMLTSDDQEAKTDYFNVAQQLFDDFNNSLQNDEITEEQQEYLSDLSQNLATLKQIAPIGQLTNEQVTTYYLQNSPQRAKQYIQSHYATLLSSSSENIQTYAQNIVNYQSWLVDYLVFLSDNKCITDNNIDTTCAESLGLSEETQQQRDTLEASFAASATLLYAAAANVIDDSTQIAATLGIINLETDEDTGADS